MALYSASAVTTITTATALTPVAAFRASTTQRAEVRRIRVYQRTAGTSPNELLIMRSTALGVTPSGTVVGNAYDNAAVATTGQLEIGWATPPTVGAATTAIEALMGDATPGNAYFFEYDLVRSIFVPSGGGTGSLVFANANATALATYRIVVAWEE